MWVAPALLIAVVGIAVVGRVGSVARPAGPAAPDPARASAQVAVVPVTPAVATPSPRSDWPASIGKGAAATVAPPVARLPREEGTDGLMGRLPFGLPGDTPTIRLEPVNRFTIDDVHLGWAGLDTTPPWVRRLGTTSSRLGDPYVR